MNKILIDFISGGILTSICTSIVYYFSNPNSTKIIGFMYGGPILFAYIIYRIFIQNGIDHAKLFANYTLLGVLSSLLMILPWIFLTPKNINKLLIFSSIYLVMVYMIYFPYLLRYSST